MRKVPGLMASMVFVEDEFTCAKTAVLLEPDDPVSLGRSLGGKDDFQSVSRF